MIASMSELLANALVPRAAVVGIFGGIGLALTSIYSRRGPMIYPVYAALLAALAALLARHSQLSFEIRMFSALVGFAVATAISYVVVAILARRQRQVLVLDGRVPPGARGVSLWGHVWRWTFLLSIGAALSAALAFVSA